MNPSVDCSRHSLESCVSFRFLFEIPQKDFGILQMEVFIFSLKTESFINILASPKRKSLFVTCKWIAFKDFGIPLEGFFVTSIRGCLHGGRKILVPGRS